MKTAKRSWDLVSPDKRKDGIRAVTDFFRNERGEEIGMIAAEDPLDACLQAVAHDIYNKGVADAKACFQGRLGDIELDIEVLKR